MVGGNTTGGECSFRPAILDCTTRVANRFILGEVSLDDLIPSIYEEHRSRFLHSRCMKLSPYLHSFRAYLTEALDYISSQDPFKTGVCDLQAALSLSKKEGKHRYVSFELEVGFRYTVLAIDLVEPGYRIYTFESDIDDLVDQCTNRVNDRLDKVFRKYNI